MSVCQKGGITVDRFENSRRNYLGIILVLCIPVSVCAQFDKTFEVKIKYLFLTFTVIPGKEKKKKEKPEKETKKNEVAAGKKEPTAAKQKKTIFL